MVAADQLEDHVVGARRLRVRRPELEDLLEVMAGDARDRRAGLGAELHARNADAAGGAVHEQPLAGHQLRLREERVVRRREHLDEAARLRPADRLGDGQHVRLVHDDELRVPAAGEERHHVLAAFGLARALEAGDVLRRAGRRRVVAGALQDVGAVDPAGAHADQDLAVAGNRIGTLLDLEPPVDDYCRAHYGML